MSQNQNLRLIIIDDNPAIHQDFIKILMTSKPREKQETDIQLMEKTLFGEENKENLLPQFEIDTATQGKEGFEKIARAVNNGNPYALAFVDIRMPPGWDGIETIKHIWELDSSIQIVICTAYSDYTWEETVEQLGHKDNLLILKKPFDTVSVRQLACALTKKWQLMQESKEYTSSLEERVRRRTESLNKSLSMMRATLESSADGILVVSNDGTISDFNNKFIDIWHFPESVINTHKFDIMLEYIFTIINNADEFSEQINKVRVNPGEIILGHIKFKDNRIFEYYAQPYTIDNQMIGRVWSFRDISIRASLEEELQYQATHDLLTGLPNRVLLRDRLKQAMANYDRNYVQFGILFLDLDRFKLINDSISHEAGDYILCSVTERLKSVLRNEDTLARLGGDEFIVIANNIKNINNLADLAKKLLETFDDHFIVEGNEVMLSTSIGVCLYPDDGKNVDLLLRNADIAMYHAKELGANQYQFYTDELNEKNHERLMKEMELRQAIENNEFILYFQPQFDLKSEKLVSVEALIRWQHPARGLIPPLDFIPLAEETGLIVPIGEWVLRSALKQIKKWQNEGLPEIRVAVNITTKQFKLYNLVNTITEILKETRVEPKFLELELTENMIINNVDIINTVHQLKKMGIQIVLDDFGTGYSSLNYLRQIPIDRLKIDQSYVQNIDSKRGDDVIIQAIIAMAKGMNLEVLAEGVESESQLEYLKKQKCGEVQGFYFSKPISANDCEKLLRQCVTSNLEDETLV
ncbi:Cyclic di-GMP phosphodiesterase Gmr [Aquicella siphonis]|uniref:cyclic-guanylate-specific phosphodiesterase n=1 Tax=Aquicella siphonis TaxID=254247 RepID=A0A5E4PFY8_9COXI|nr:EAL domain-containing protein [Aquicella siphonis]VVC75418.1 Cyclic di-GMP phosphodiesterase Gmr [Aquicella siphonis]